MNRPIMFEDEISDRLRDLRHGDKIIIHHGDTTETLSCYESAIYEDGIVSPFRRFETAHGSFVDHITERLYDYLENGCDVIAVIGGTEEPFCPWN